MGLFSTLECGGRHQQQQTRSATSNRDVLPHDTLGLGQNGGGQAARRILVGATDEPQLKSKYTREGNDHAKPKANGIDAEDSVTAKTARHDVQYHCFTGT